MGVPNSQLTAIFQAKYQLTILLFWPILSELLILVC